ncbi:MAG: hypothetical protein EOP47_27775, partial [Sphingobacteriaceae bacterium]
MAIGEALYQQTSDQHAYLYNTGWAGAFGFNLLGGSNPYETFRLYQWGAQAKVDTLGDLQDILYAVASYSKGLQASYITGGVSGILGLVIGLADALEYAVTNQIPEHDPYTPHDIMAQINIAVSSGDWLGLINSVAARTPVVKPIVDFIETVGLNHFLDMLIGTTSGKTLLGETTDGNFAGKAKGFFDDNSLQTRNIQFLDKFTLTQLIALAKQDAGVRAALSATSSVAIQVSAPIRDQFDLYNVETGEGEITEEWIKDRAAFVKWREIFDKNDTDYTDRLNSLNGLLPMPVKGDFVYKDITGHLNLDIDGINPTDLESHYIIFGGLSADHIEGGDIGDKLYGGKGDDIIEGGKGSDYIEGGEGSDTYIFNTADNYGNDIIFDSDGEGKIVLDGITITTGKRLSRFLWESTDGIYHIAVVPDIPVNGIQRNKLIMAKKNDPKNAITILNWEDGNLGITLGLTNPVPPVPALDRIGTRNDDPLITGTGYLWGGMGN